MSVRISITEQTIPADGLRWLHVLATDAAGRLAGSCLVTTWEGECPCLCYLHVTPTKRGRGIGTAIIRAVIDRCRRAKKRTITLVVNKRNRRAERLYRRLGFMQFTDDKANRWMAVPLAQAKRGCSG